MSELNVAGRRCSTGSQETGGSSTPHAADPGLYTGGGTSPLDLARLVIKVRVLHRDIPSQSTDELRMKRVGKQSSSLLCGRTEAVVPRLRNVSPDGDGSWRWSPKV